MGKIKPLMICLGVVCALVVIYFFMRIVGSAMQGYSWREMDWNQDGTTSISEFFAASDIGKREIATGEKKCMEYFAYKDGFPVKTVCPK